MSSAHKSLSLLGLATLVALPLATPQAAAQALTLQSGDNLTVSGAGTAGTYQGAPVNTPTGSYSSSFASVSSNSGTVAIPGGAAFTLKSGGSLTASGQYTAGLYAAGTSSQRRATITVSGGTIMGTGIGSPALQVNNYSDVTVTGGTLTSYSSPALFVTGSTAMVTGGSFSSNDTVAAWEEAVSLSRAAPSPPGGPAVEAGFTTYQPSTVTITGGTFTTTGSQGYNVEADQGSMVIVSGGVFSDTAFSPNSQFHAESNGIIDLFGTFDGHPSGSQISPFTSGTITGTLLSGQRFNATYTNLSGVIEFNVGPAPAPEPSQSAALGLGVLGLCGLALRARRKAPDA